MLCICNNNKCSPKGFIRITIPSVSLDAFNILEAQEEVARGRMTRGDRLWVYRKYVCRQVQGFGNNWRNRKESLNIYKLIIRKL